MDFEYIVTALSAKIERRCFPRFSRSEVEKSLSQLAARWVYALDYHEKKAIARQLGGNKYAKTAHALLDELFEGIANAEHDNYS